MIWSTCKDYDAEQVVQLTQQPMHGKIRFAWGLNQYICPESCHSINCGVLRSSNKLRACALSWQWPDGSRYLSMLRIDQKSAIRPSSRTWKRAYQMMLADAPHAWTSIGVDNIRSRRLLESGAKWLPRYYPQQKLRTWFVPLRNSQTQSQSKTKYVVDAYWRYASIHTGLGTRYKLGRTLFRIGLPGIPPPGKKLRIAHVLPNRALDSSNAAIEMKQNIKQLGGYDGAVVVLPESHPYALEWNNVAPKISWCWDSILYSVSWIRGNDFHKNLKIPEWEGSWL